MLSIGRAHGRGNSRGWIAIAVMLAAFFGIARIAQAHNPHDPILAFAASPEFATDQTMFAAGLSELNWGYADILRSTDRGRSWTRLPRGMVNRVGISSIRVSPNFATDRTVYAATKGDGVFRSVDGGDSWTLINTGLAAPNILSLEVARTADGGHMMYAVGNTGGLFRRGSKDSAWTKIYATTTKFGLLAVSPNYAGDATVLAVDSTNTLWRSTNSGAQWTSLGQPIGATIYDLAIAPGGLGEVFAATSLSGMFYSTDWGKTFVRKTATLPAEALTNVAISPNYATDRTVFCTGIAHAAYRSTDGGNTWIYFKTGAFVTRQTTARNEFTDLAVSPSYAADLTVFLPAFAGLFMSQNAGQAWVESQTREVLTTGLAISPTYESDKRVMATAYYGEGLYRSFNSGASWSRMWDGWPTVLGKLSAFDIDFVPNHTGTPMVVATRNHSNFGISADFGTTWNVVSIPNMLDVAPGNIYPTSLGVSPAFDTDRTLFFGTRAHGLLQTRDAGATWLTKRGVPLTQITSVAVSPVYGSDGTAFAANTAGQVWRTRDSGDTWSRVGATSIVTKNGTKYMWLAISPSFAVDHLMWVGTNNGVFVSIDGGDNWSAIPGADIGPGSIVQRIEFSPAFARDRLVYVGVRGKGMYKLTLNGLGQVASSTNVGASLLADHVQFAEFRLSPGFERDATIFGAAREAVYRSTDAGATWALAGYPSVPSAPNNAPQFAPISDVTTAEGDTISILISASDSDGNALQLSAANVPVGASFTDLGGGSGRLDWTPGYDAAGSYTVMFTADDGVTSTQATLNIVVQNTNRAPVWTAVSDFSVTEGDAIELSVVASDPDGDTLTLDAANLPPAAKFVDQGAGSGLLQWNTGNGDAGSYSIQFDAGDGATTATMVVNVKVLPPP